MTLLTSAATSTSARHDVDFGNIAAIAVIPLLMLVISVLIALQNPDFADVLSAMG